MQYPPEFIHAHNLLILGQNDLEVELGYCGSIDHHLILTLQNFHQKQLRLSPVDRTRMNEILRKSYAEDWELEEGLSGVNNKLPALQEESFVPDELYRDAPLVNLVNALIIDGLKQRASDIHLEPCGENVRVRFRIDGIMTEVGRVSPGRYPGICSRIKVMARLDVMDKRRPQDGSFTVEHGGSLVRIRVSVLPAALSESVSLRILNSERGPLDIVDLGFSRRRGVFLEGLCRCRRGLILFAGPTGSGKTTTLNSLIKRLMGQNLKIVSIEDPVEYRLAGVCQIETNPEIGLDFASILRRVLRHDPDVILVGEIRDRETALLAAEASITGHLVLASIHAGRADDVSGRLKYLGIENDVLPFVLAGVLSQRLLRRNCKHCIKEYKPEPKEMVLLQKHGLQAALLMKGAGCPDCGGSGYFGRFAVGEVLRGKGGGRRRSSLISNALRRAADGITTVEEVVRSLF